MWRGPAEALPHELPQRRASGKPLAEPPGDYWLVAPNGDVIKSFQSLAWSVEDELGASLFTIADGSLIELSVLDRFREDVSIRETVAVAGLSEVAENDVAEVLRVADAVRHAEAAQAERRMAAEQNGRDRVAAIPGALDGYDAGDAFHRAHERLSAQISSYYAPTSEAMLRRLMVFGSLHRAASAGWRGTLAWAMEPFVTACRIVANDPYARSTQSPETAGDPSPAPPEQRRALRELMESLRELHAEVLQSAEWAEDSDARNTAIGLRQAAEGIEEARTRLERVVGDEGSGGA